MHFRPSVLINFAQLGVEYFFNCVDLIEAQIHKGFDHAWDLANDLEKRYF